MCRCYFLEYILIFFFFFVLFFIFIEKKVPCPQRERRSQVFWRGERDDERRADGGRGGRTLGALEYPSFFSHSFSLPLCGASLRHTSVMRKTPPACLVSGR